MEKEKNSAVALKRRRNIAMIAGTASALFLAAATFGRTARQTAAPVRNTSAVGEVGVITAAGRETSSETKDFSAYDNSSDTSYEREDGITETIVDVVPESAEGTDETTGILSSPDEIWLFDADGRGTNYVFTYDGEEFDAVYTPDNWKIIDSYKIVNPRDITLICEALSGVHPIHGADMESYRTPEDMAYEWQQHNRAYATLPRDSEWREHAKDVDLDPADQGKDVYALYRSRIGESIPIIDKLFG